MHSVVLAMLLVPAIPIIVLWIYHILVNRRARAVARNLPTIFPTIPIFGNLHQILIKNVREKTLDLFKYARNGVWTTTCVWVGPYPIFILNNAEDIQAVLSESKTRKSGQYEFMKFVLGEGLLSATGCIHTITRRYINPLFQPRNLDNLVPIFNESSRQLVDSLSEHVGAGEVDVSIPVGHTTLMNIACLIFGAEIKINMNSKEFEGLTNLGPRIGRVFLQRLLKPWLWFESVFRFLMRKEIQTIYQLWRQFADGPLKFIERRANEEGQKYEMGFEHGKDDKERLQETFTLPDIFRNLKKNHPEFTDQHLHHQSITLVIAGSDTTRIAISSCLLAIADRADVQEKLMEEISKVLGSSNKDVTAQDLHNMPYLDQVFKETIRKYCIIPIILRETKEDIKLRSCTLPANSSVMINFLGLHHNPSEFPEPNKFDPERFSLERVARMKRFSYLPFSGGSRNCIGTIYAGMLVKTVVIHVLRRYRLTTSMDSNNLTFRMGIGLISDRGYRIELHDRN